MCLHCCGCGKCNRADGVKMVEPGVCPACGHANDISQVRRCEKCGVPLAGTPGKILDE